jgi:hypothetical protein
MAQYICRIGAWIADREDFNVAGASLYHGIAKNFAKF